MNKILVSACLAGSPVRYDGRAAPIGDSEIFRRWIETGAAVLVCPEVSGDLPTPRAPAEIVGGSGADVLAGKARVITTNDIDVTDAFVLGANRVLAIAHQHDAKAALLQARSPSCGRQTYDGTFSKTLVDRFGVTVALLEQHGIRVFGPDQIADADAFLRGVSGTS